MLPRVTNFNSIKVQLEPLGANVFCMSEEFQFHKGTIRTGDDSEAVTLTGISIP